MGYQNLTQAVADLERTGQLVRVSAPVSADIEAGIIQRRAFAKGSPAILFQNVAGTRFPMLANLFGTRQRVRYLFRDALRGVEALLAAKADPPGVLKKPWQSLGVPRTLFNALPRTVGTGPVMQGRCAVSDLPQLKSWPMDGGAYVTLPQVYSEDPGNPGVKASNLGMYRVQLSGGEYEQDAEVGLHYQIHRGIGPHHSAALARGQRLPVSVFVGGPPSLTVAAVMPLPEGVPELFFAGGLGGRRVALVDRKRTPNGLPLPAEADFVICGHLEPNAPTKPEGPFGDHLGYYSLAHGFPVMRVDAVLHRPNAIWPFTTVGRPPQEDTVFGDFIHELTHDLIPTVFTGVSQVHAVDAAGVHPLLLAVGSERYVPFAEDRIPQELLTNAMSLLGTSQTSLSKYVLIAAAEDQPPPARDIPAFLSHLLARMDFSRDLHFITRTTMDTLDYSGISLNQGSKVVWAACGKPKRQLCAELPQALASGSALPEGFHGPVWFAPGIAVLGAPPHTQNRDAHDPWLQTLAEELSRVQLPGLALIVLADDPEFTAASWDNFLWVAFTRSDPATDTYGAGSFTHCKHWGCAGPLIMDARRKTYHAPPLEPDPEAEKRVDEMARKGGPLEGLV